MGNTNQQGKEKLCRALLVLLETKKLREITVKDLGCGIEDVAKARQPMFTTGGADRSGMGMTIMESFMNALSIRSRPGRGTTVRMKKKLVGRGDPDCKPRS